MSVIGGVCLPEGYWCVGLTQVRDELGLVEVEEGTDCLHLGLVQVDVLNSASVQIYSDWDVPAE